jgi:hypothetical protein
MGFLDLLKPKWEHSDIEVRKAAVEALSDQSILEILSEIALNDTDCNVRAYAVLRLTDSNILTKITETDKDWQARKFAYSKLGKEQEALRETVIHSGDKEECKSAIKKITDQSVLTEIVKLAKSAEIAYLAKVKLDNQLLPEFYQVLTEDDFYIESAPGGDFYHSNKDTFSHDIIIDFNKSNRVIFNNSLKIKGMLFAPNLDVSCHQSFVVDGNVSVKSLTVGEFNSPVKGEIDIKGDLICSYAVSCTHDISVGNNLTVGGYITSNWGNKVKVGKSISAEGINAPDAQVEAPTINIYKYKIKAMGISGTFSPKYRS